MLLAIQMLFTPDHLQELCNRWAMKRRCDYNHVSGLPLPT